MKDFPWGYVVGAAVTVIGLLFNQWRADKRDKDRWDKEVARDQVKWDRERAERQEQWLREDHARTEQWKREDRRRWVDEQRTLYATSLKNAKELLGLLSRIHIELAWTTDSDDRKVKIQRYTDQLDSMKRDFDQAVSEVLIIAGDSAMGDVTRLSRSVHEAFVNARFWSAYSEDKLESSLAESHEAYNDYFSSVRQELGLSEPTLPETNPALGS
jgi:hypothetical protein